MVPVEMAASILLLPSRGSKTATYLGREGGRERGEGSQNICWEIYGPYGHRNDKRDEAERMRKEGREERWREGRREGGRGHTCC